MVFGLAGYLHTTITDRQQTTFRHMASEEIMRLVEDYVDKNVGKKDNWKPTNITHEQRAATLVVPLNDGHRRCVALSFDF